MTANRVNSKIIYNNYKIYDNGDLYSYKSNKFLSVKPNKNGYVYYCLSINNKRYYKRAHRLVAENFIPNLQNKTQVNHKNGNKTDNCKKNLEWVTSSENNIHAYNVLNKKAPHTNKKGILNHCSKKVKQFDLKGNLIKIWDCIADVKRELNINPSHISGNARGRFLSAGGFKWKYVKNISLGD